MGRRSGLGLRGQVVGKMAEQPFIAIGGPGLQVCEGATRGCGKMLRGAGGQQAFENGWRGGWLATRRFGGGGVTLVIQKTTDVEWGGPCQHLPLYTLRIAYGEGSVGSFHLSKVIFFLFETAVIKKVQVLEVLVEAEIVFVTGLGLLGRIAASSFFCL
jgi:hypothetical protein